MNTKKCRIVMIRSNPVAPDPRVEKEARVLAEFAEVEVLAWDRTGTLPTAERTQYGLIRRSRLPAPYGSLKIMLGLFRFNLWVAVRLAFGRYDIIHACDLDTGLCAMLLAKIRSKRLVYDMFDMYSEANSEALPRFALRLAWLLEREVVRRANVTIIVDDSRRDQLEGMRPNRLEVIYNSPEQIPLAAKVFSHKGLEVFYAGVLARNRGFEYLVEAITRADGACLTVGGFGADEAYVRQKVLAAGSSARFIGRIAYAEVLRRSSQADILFALYDPAVKNHRYSSPNKLFEAMLLGKPIIVSDGTGMSDIVRRVGNGIVIEYGNPDALTAAVETLKNPQLRRRMGERGRSAYEREYGWTIMADRLRRLYADLL